MCVIGFDFSINKPAATIYDARNGSYHFYIWPYKMKDKLKDIYRSNGVNVIDRLDNNDSVKDISEKMRNEVERADYVSSCIIDSIKPFLNNNTFISFEGLSYASGGNVGIQLGGYKYILMCKLSEFVPYSHMYTYSPQTLKSVAGCSKKGMGKNNMIDAFVNSDITSTFREVLANSPKIFQTAKSNNWGMCVDDIADSYWAVRTFLTKEHDFLFKMSINYDKSAFL